MSRGSKLTDEERIAAVQEYLEGRGSYEAIAKKYGIALQTLRQKVIYAKTNGIESIRISHTNKQYSAETKLKAVTEYLNGKGSQVEICRRYHISDMNKGRKTTHEERVEIVAFCIEHGKDYGLAMEKYGVSYQQIYSWVRKYEAKGVEGLTDRRGKAKPEDALTEADRLRMENKILQAKIKDQEMEIKLLKKLKELEGGDW